MNRIEELQNIEKNLLSLGFWKQENYIYGFNYLFNGMVYTLFLSLHQVKRSNPKSLFTYWKKYQGTPLQNPQTPRIIYLHKNIYKELLSPHLLVNSKFRKWLDQILYYYETIIKETENLTDDFYLDGSVFSFFGQKYQVFWFNNQQNEVQIDELNRKINVYVENQIYKYMSKRNSFFMSFLENALYSKIQSIQSKWEKELNLPSSQIGIAAKLRRKNVIAQNWVQKNRIEYTFKMVFWNQIIIENIVVHELLHSYFKNNHFSNPHNAQFYKKGNELIKDFDLLENLL